MAKVYNAEFLLPLVVNQLSNWKNGVMNFLTEEAFGGRNAVFIITDKQRSQA